MEVKFIELTKGQFVLVDHDDYEKYNKDSWSFNITGASGYARRGRDKKYLHRLIFGEPLGKEIDHINRDTLDCRKANLRISTRSQNTHNHPKRKNNISGHVGIWRRECGKWAAEIMINYKKKCLGTFESIDDAIEARCRAEEEIYGEFKRHE